MDTTVMSNWKCPYCNQIASTALTFPFTGEANHKAAKATRFMSGRFTLCPNPTCKEYEIACALYDAFYSETRERIIATELLQQWRLIPPSNATIYPDYVPSPIIQDYQEACLIRDLSPKASATLARRALQGMIRDFWGVTKPNLALEINAIKDKVDGDTWEAIDGVRHVGNIGAHMEKDINTIIDVDPEEAGQLIWLIETLIEEWYINRETRKKRLTDLKDLAESKKQAKKPTPDMTPLK